MAATGTVTINIVGDANRLKSALSESESGLSRFGDKVENVGKSMMGFGAKLTIGVTAPLALIGKQAFDAASDLNESLSKVGVVFGDMALDVIAWANNAAEAMGISRQAALEAAGTFGNFLQAMGVLRGPATDMSKRLVQLASDLASFNNADPSEVLINLRAALSGEIEPMRKFGVALTADRVNAKALSMGLWEQKGMTEAAAKAMATFQIILDDTAMAQGDFGRTAGGAANQQRIMAAKLKDVEAQLGQALIPIFLQLADVLQQIGAWFASLDPKWQKLIVYAALAAAAIGPLVTVIGALVTVVGILISPITLVVLAIAAVVAAIILMWLKWDQIWNFMKDHPAIMLVVSILAAPVAALFLIVGAVKFLYENWSTIWPEIQRIAEDVWSVLKPVYEALNAALYAIGDAADFLADVFEAAWPHMQAVVVTAWNVIRPVLVSCRDGIQAIIDVGAYISAHAGEWFSAFSNAVLELWNVVDGPLHFILEVLKKIIAAAGEVKDALNKLPSPGDFIPDVTPGIDIPFFGASGAVVTRPTFALIGEAGPEALVPLNQAPGASSLPGGGALVGHMTIVAPSPVEAANAIVQRLRAEAFLAGMN